MDAKSINYCRLLAAMVISPLVPILALAMLYWLNTGSKAWFPIFIIFGYLFFLIFGVPVAAVLMKKGDLSHCLVGGGVAAVAPLIVLGSLSLFSSGSALNAQTLGTLVLVFLSGCVGGGIFWLIAFARKNLVP